MEKQIIDAVYAREELWNPKHKNHKNVNVLQRKWAEIAEEIGQNAKVVKNKWKYLRDYFQRECRKMSKLGAGEKLGSPWQYFNMMLFVKDGPHSGNTVSNSREPDKINDKGKKELHVTNLNSQSKILPAPSVASTQSTPTCTSSVIKIEKSVGIEEEILKARKRRLELLEKDGEKEDDEDLHFFKSILKDIKTLPPRQKRRLRLKVHQLVVEEVEEAERHSAP